jgi:hypothetical protein
MLALAPSSRPMADCVGVGASAACAVHCALAPMVPLFAPAIVSWWSSPVVHILGALLVVPLALVTLHRGRWHHGRNWPVCCGWLGCAAICLALLPWWAALTPVTWSWGTPAAVCGHAGCCPSVVVDDAGGSISLPWAALITLLGSLLLVAGHVGNLRGRLCCRASGTTQAAGPCFT